MKKQTSNILFCVTVVAIVVAAILIDRRSAPAPKTEAGDKPAAAKKVKAKKQARPRKAAVERPKRAAGNAAAAADAIPAIGQDMDEKSFADWFAPRPPRTGDEMADIPEDEEEYPIRQLDAQARFRQAVFNTMADSSVDHVALARRLMASSYSSVRALGAALLVESGAFSSLDAAVLADDDDASVPLSILEWIRERGTASQLAALEAALASRGMTSEDIVAVLTSLSSATGGGREALDLLIKTAPEEDLPELLATVASAEAAAYDVRMQALMALRGAAPFSVADNVMVKMELAAEPPTESLWGESLDLYSDLVDLAANDKAPYKVWDVLTRDLEFLSTLDYENSVRDMANYVENGVRSDDPVIQEGSWRIIDDYISEIKSSEIASDAAVAEPLARLERLNEKLKPFDPEFAVADPDPVPEVAVAEDEEAEVGEDEGPGQDDEPVEPAPDDEPVTTDENGNPTGSGSTTVPIGKEIIEPYKP
ncbi:MAG: hypothetical protein ILM98_14530 [Kiritimatiellae bacterium]|nr:hypothetical protein [Kiritimatiellia bacterium]